MGGYEKFIAIRRELHEIPELGFQEFKTQHYLLTYIQSIATEYVEVKTWKTGILVKVHGYEPSKTIGYRADMDGLPIQEETNLAYQSVHDNYMHACGHDFHMAIALGVLTNVIKERVKDDVVFLFQPAEEGPGGALPMLQSDVFQLWKPDLIFALHLAPQYPVGTIATKQGLLFAHTSELFIDLKGKGGHAAFPHKTKDMVVAGAHLITQLQTIIARNIDPLDSGVITIGKMTGGTVQNIIAEQCRLEGTIRTLSKQSMIQIKERIEQVVKGIEISFDCQAMIDYGSMYCGVYNDEALTEQFMAFTRANDNWKLIDCEQAMTGEDFGYFVEAIPGFMFWLGADASYGLHHAKLQPNEELLSKTIPFVTGYIHYLSESN
ncbi:MAG: N-acetyldiaminopimelate deacetylase [Bacillaceae bacterium]